MKDGYLCYYIYLDARLESVRTIYCTSRYQLSTYIVQLCIESLRFSHYFNIVSYSYSFRVYKFSLLYERRERKKKFIYFPAMMVIS